MQCTLIHEVGKRYLFGQSWHSLDGEYHVTEYPLTKEQFKLSNYDDLQKEFGTPKICTRCQRNYEGEKLERYGSERRVYNNEDGLNNHVGDMFFAPWMHSDNGKCSYWDNCNHPEGHLMVVLPNGHVFDTDSRSSNCTKPDDRTHRCWEKHGEAPLITIGGPTSDNGVGSIGMADWHGYLTNGILDVKK